MSDVTQNGSRMPDPPARDVLDVLRDQHARIRALFVRVKGAADVESRQEAFDELRALLAMHETAEEMVLRPVSIESAGKGVAEARNREEAQANEVLAGLEALEVGNLEFDSHIAEFEKAVIAHAEAEEREEFPWVAELTDERDRQRMGSLLVAVEKAGPTHPHSSTAGSPLAQWTLGPFVAMVDAVRDVITKVSG